MNRQVGSSPQLTLRVSVATLSRIIFPHPDNNTPVLALEHKATVHEEGDEPTVAVKVQPFGGAVRILKSESLLKTISEFNYDSERSRSENDFRIFIQPSKWSALLEFCKRESQTGLEAALDCDPARELAEEFKDALEIQLTAEDYVIERLGLVVEKDPEPTSNIRAPDYPTARVYWIDEVRITNPDLCRQMLRTGRSSEELGETALKDWKDGGRGRANAMFAAPLDSIRAAYLKLTPEERCEPLKFEGFILSSNVPAILDGLDSPKYESIV